MNKLQQQFEVSERRACRVVDQPRSSQRYEPQPRSDEGLLVKRMLQLSRQRPRYGYRRIGCLLRREAWQASNTRVYRLWRREGLRVRKKRRKRRATGSDVNACHRHQPERKNQIWCWDFIYDRTTNGSVLKCLSIVDEYTRECLALKMDRSFTSEDVIDTLAELFAIQGVPDHIRSDNGPEFVAKAIQGWLAQLGIETLYVEPGSPWQNGYAESFHSRLRDEFLSQEEFESLRSARKLTAQFQEDYNNHRPHSSLGYLTPREFSDRCPISSRGSVRLPMSQRTLPNPTPITTGTEI